MTVSMASDIVITKESVTEDEGMTAAVVGVAGATREAGTGAARGEATSPMTATGGAMEQEAATAAVAVGSAAGADATGAGAITDVGITNGALRPAVTAIAGPASPAASCRGGIDPVHTGASAEASPLQSELTAASGARCIRCTGLRVRPRPTCCLHWCYECACVAWFGTRQ